MASEKELSAIGSSLGVFVAFLFLLFSFFSLMTNFVLFNFIYYVLFIFMICGPISMILLMIFKPILDQRKLDALNSSIQSSSKINFNFFLNYSFLVIAYTMPFIFNAHIVLKSMSVIAFLVTFIMLYKMFCLNKKISVENKNQSQ